MDLTPRSGLRLLDDSEFQERINLLSYLLLLLFWMLARRCTITRKSPLIFIYHDLHWFPRCRFPTDLSGEYINEFRTNVLSLAWSCEDPSKVIWDINRSGVSPISSGICFQSLSSSSSIGSKMSFFFLSSSSVNSRSVECWDVVSARSRMVRSCYCAPMLLLLQPLRYLPLPLSQWLYPWPPRPPWSLSLSDIVLTSQVKYVPSKFIAVYDYWLISVIFNVITRTPPNK